MGIFDRIFHKQQAKMAAEFFETLTGYTPIFTSWGGQIYESELCRSAVHAFATHASKLLAVVEGSAAGSYRNILTQKVNPWQTPSQFLYRLATILEVYNTAFILPIFEDESIVGYFPALPQKVVAQEAKDGSQWYEYTFANGQIGTLRAEEVGIITKFQCKNDLYGESNRALDPTMELMNIQNQGIVEGVKSAATFRFMAKLSNFAKPEDIAKEQKRFTKENFAQESGGGVLLFPNTYSELQQITSKPFVIDAEQQRLIKENVYDYFGTNADILQNKAVGDKWSAYYEGKVEPFAIQVSEVMTNMTFHGRAQSYGNKIMWTANRLQYMTNQDKLSVSAQMADRGIMNRDEIREIWNMPPLPNGQGQAYTIRGEYYLLNEDGSVTKKGDDLTSGDK